MKIHSNNLNKNIGGEGGSFLKDDLQIYSKEDVIKEALKYANGQKNDVEMKNIINEWTNKRMNKWMNK